MLSNNILILEVSFFRNRTQPGGLKWTLHHLVKSISSEETIKHRCKIILCVCIWQLLGSMFYRTMVCRYLCLSGGVIMLVAHPGSPPALLYWPPSLFIYPGLIQSNGRSVCGKGSVPRQPSVTEQCIRTLRHQLLRKKINHTPPDALEAEKGTSHTFLKAILAGSAALFPSRWL